jgi:uncharacterized membrane protein YedE/YeeE
MTIDWMHFSPWMALTGGVLIGMAAAILVLLDGRILGVSGILGGLLSPRPGDIAWRLCFFAGLAAAPLTLSALLPADAIAPPRIGAGWVTLVIAGLLVGFGTRMGGGCTSGHGVCGLSRLSPRSLVATLTFMAAGFATVFVVRHLMGVSA